MSGSSPQDGVLQFAGLVVVDDLYGDGFSACVPDVRSEELEGLEGVSLEEVLDGLAALRYDPLAEWPKAVSKPAGLTFCLSAGRDIKVRVA